MAILVLFRKFEVFFKCQKCQNDRSKVVGKKEERRRKKERRRKRVHRGSSQNLKMLFPCIFGHTIVITTNKCGQTDTHTHGQKRYLTKIMTL